MIRVLLNGEAVDVQEGWTVINVLQSLDIPAERVAVELNRKIVKQADWGTAELREGAELEIVHFVGGG